MMSSLRCFIATSAKAEQPAREAVQVQIPADIASAAPYAVSVPWQNGAGMDKAEYAYQPVFRAGAPRFPRQMVSSRAPKAFVRSSGCGSLRARRQFDAASRFASSALDAQACLRDRMPCGHTVHTHIYIYIHTHTHTYLYTYTYIYIHKYIMYIHGLYVCMYVCAYVCMYVCTYVCMYVYRRLAA